MTTAIPSPNRRLERSAVFLLALGALHAAACGDLLPGDSGDPGDGRGDECGDGTEQCGDADRHDTNTIYRCENGYWYPFQDCGSLLCTKWGPDDATCQSW